MAGPRPFDREQVVGRALELFWRQGFEATSVDDLVSSTGVARPSLYSAFGDKRRLYQEALETYCRREDARLATVLGGDGPVLPRLRGLIEAIIETTATEGAHSGCFVVSVGVECADAQLCELVEDQYRRMVEHFTEALVRARDSGELSPSQEPRALARLLVLVISGVRAASRAGVEPELVQDGARAALAALGGLGSKSAERALSPDVERAPDALDSPTVGAH